jgi:hypothetical protein
LFQIYTNLLTTRLRSVPQIMTLAWPAASLPREVEDRAADRLGHIPFTQETFDKLGMLLAEHVGRNWKPEHPSASTQPENRDALIEYLKNLKVQVSLTPALPENRDHIDRLLRSAASISLTGEQRDLTDGQIDDLLTTRENVLVNVKDRLADYGVAGVVSYRFDNENMIVDAMSVSCAVLGKQVEYGIISGLVQIAAEHEVSNVVFEYRPASRNQATAAFLKSVADTDSETRYVLPVKAAEERLSATMVAGLSLKFASNLACSR